MMEDYKKRLDEVLASVKQLAENNPSDEGIQNWVQDNFPELKESEDERIRKKLIEAVKGDMVVGGTKDKQLALAWLEKQGGKESVTCPICGWEIEKQGEQKPADIRTTGYWNVEDVEQKTVDKYKEWYDFIRWFVEQRTDDYTLIPSDDDIHKWGDNILNHARKVLDKQNSAWNEGDEKIYQSIMDDTVQENQLNDKQTNWLRDIKYRYFPQPKQEWSEEDESHIKRIIEHLEGRKKDLKTQWVAELHNKEIDWLKSLRPQNVWISVDEEVYVKEPVLAQKKDKSDSFGGFVVCCDHTLTPNVYERYVILGNIVSQNRWKPSDEQMIAIQEAMNIVGILTITGSKINSLYQDLKKLKEG